MKKKILDKVTACFLVFMAMISLTSCEPDEELYSVDILTSYNWELVAINGVPVNELDVCEFQFYNFGNGTYGRYNEYGSWYEIPIQWEAALDYGNMEYLYVYPSGTDQIWEYEMRIYGNYRPILELYDLATRDRLTFQTY